MGAAVQTVSTAGPLWGWWQELKLRSQRKDVTDLSHQMNSSRPPGPETITWAPSPNSTKTFQICCNLLLAYQGNGRGTDNVHF